MSCEEDSSAGPSNQKKRKVQHNESPTDNEENAHLLDTNLLSELSDEYPSDFSYDSEDDLIPSNNAYDISDSEDEEHMQRTRRQWQDSTVVDSITWENDSTSMEQFPFTKSECLLQPILGDNPIDYFCHFLTENILDEIVTQTNEYAGKILHRHKLKGRCRMNAWKDTTKDEILAFVGLILHMGTIRINHIQDYWKTDALFGLRVFSENMSRNRFVLLLKTLHFANILEQNAESSNDRLYKIKRMVDFFNTRVSEIYYPGREIRLDESMTLWRGQFVFRQYIPSNKHSIKLHMITTPDGMILKFMVDSSVLDNSSEEEHTRNVVLNLLEDMLDAGHSVFMDKFYNSYELAKCLAYRKTHCTGTIRKHMKTFPKDLSNKKLKKGETVAKYANGVMIAKWRDKRDVTYISNEYKNEIMQMTNNNGKLKSKPLPVIQYDVFMSGIDKQEQMLAYYPHERKTIRWPTKIFVYVLQLMMTNAYFIYNKYSGENMSLYHFRLSVIRCLLKRPSVQRAPVSDSSKLEHILMPREQKKSGKTQRKQCKSCYSRGIRKDTIYVCKVCDGSPGYCLGCVKITHQ